MPFESSYPVKVEKGQKERKERIGDKRAELKKGES